MITIVIRLRKTRLGGLAGASSAIVNNALIPLVPSIFSVKNERPSGLYIN